MHEYSVVQALLEQVETIAKEHRAEAVTKVIVKIGMLSGVEPHLLEIAFNTFKANTVCGGADFVMQIQPLAIRCRECDRRSELKAVQYCCPHCGSLDVEVVDGEEMLLMRLELEENPKIMGKGDG